eukprot:45525-Eustigmatos_ZCMA.PRE.1
MHRGARTDSRPLNSCAILRGSPLSSRDGISYRTLAPCACNVHNTNIRGGVGQPMSHTYRVSP